MKKAGTCTLGAAALAPHTHAPARAANAPGLTAEGLKTASRRWLARLCPAERVACAGDRAMQGRARGGGSRGGWSSRHFLRGCRKRIGGALPL